MTSEYDAFGRLVHSGYVHADVAAVSRLMGYPPNMAANPHVFASKPKLTPHGYVQEPVPSHWAGLAQVPPPPSPHTHTIMPSHGHHISIGFDGSKMEEQIYTVISETNGLKHLVNHFTSDTTIQETSMTTQFRTPTETIERKDLLAALQLSAGSNHPDEVMHAVALVQDLDEGQTIVRGHQLKEGVVGRYIEVVDTGDKGYLSDWREHNLRDNYKANAVVNGKMVEIERGHYIIVDPAEA